MHAVFHNLMIIARSILNITPHKKACQRSPIGAKMWNSHTSIYILRDTLIEIEIVRNKKKTLRKKSATHDY